MNLYVPQNDELQKQSWIRNSCGLNVTQFGDDTPVFQEHTDLQENQIMKTKFTTLPCSSIWAQLKDTPFFS
jgi:hypothetical protein